MVDVSPSCEPFEGFDFVCSVCEDGNGGQICETCASRVRGFKRWLIATEEMHKAFTRFILVHRNKRQTMEPLPTHTLFWSSEEGAQERLDEMGKDGERYEIREIKVAML